MSPGTYLRKRREAFGLGIRQAAANLAGSPWTLNRPTPAEINKLAARISAAEEDARPFSLSEALLLRNVFSFDPGIYIDLVERQADPEGTAHSVPPQVCRGCACSRNDACVTDRLACHWVEPDLCSACARKLDLGSEIDLRPAQASAALAGVRA